MKSHTYAFHCTSVVLSVRRFHRRFIDMRSETDVGYMLRSDTPRAIRLLALL